MSPRDQDLQQKLVPFPDGEADADVIHVVEEGDDCMRSPEFRAMLDRRLKECSDPAKVLDGDAVMVEFFACHAAENPT